LPPNRSALAARTKFAMAAIPQEICDEKAAGAMSGGQK
jgi:hypothetical protein